MLRVGLVLRSAEIYPLFSDVAALHSLTIIQTIIALCCSHIRLVRLDFHFYLGPIEATKSYRRLIIGRYYVTIGALYVYYEL